MGLENLWVDMRVKRAREKNKCVLFLIFGLMCLFKKKKFRLIKSQQEGNGTLKITGGKRTVNGAGFQLRVKGEE